MLEERAIIPWGHPFQRSELPVEVCERAITGRVGDNSDGLLRARQASAGIANPDMDEVVGNRLAGVFEEEPMETSREGPAALSRAVLA